MYYYLIICEQQYLKDWTRYCNDWTNDINEAYSFVTKEEAEYWVTNQGTQSTRYIIQPIFVR